MIPESVNRWRTHVTLHRGSIEQDLVLAMIWQESDGDPWAYRYEPGYQYFWDGKKRVALFDKAISMSANRGKAIIALGQTEFNQQSASFGLMQVMGAVARELGMSGFATRLCEPGDGIKYGCDYLRLCFKRGGGDTREALRRYNGGSDYPDKVFAKLKSFT